MNKITLTIEKNNITNWGFTVTKDGEYWYSQIEFDSRQEAETIALSTIRGMYSKSPNCSHVEYTFDPIS